MGDFDYGPSMSTAKTTVLVTGFGEFGSYRENPSWLAVQKLSELGMPENILLEIEKMAVEYDTVSCTVPALWRRHKPALVVHVGVSGIASEIELEQQAHNDGYTKEDVKKQCPPNTCCVQDADCILQSGINMQTVCDEINGSKCGVKAIVSHDPGRYLCDFIYYQSLHMDRSRSAFIHVPPEDRPYSILELAQGLKRAVIAMVKQIS